ncbi:MAG TPA: tetratricopeptide repeat protein [Thermoanaerobaculia bacterium]|nr:tetratricopeptide repeat protein [Thermoanaerobaculia bacterium]
MRGRALLLAGAVILAPACNPKMEKPPAENPVLADLVDYRTGLTLLREGRTDEAIALLQRARASSPRDPNVSNALGLALLYKKDYKGAEKAFSDALMLNPDFLEARNNRGVTYLEANRLDDAERDFQAVLDSPASTDRANAYFNLGLVSRKRSQWPDAERNFSLSVADNPGMLRAYRERGLVRVKEENFHDALDDFLTYLKEDPKDATANYNAALCLLAVGRRDLAVKYMERAATGAPESDDGRRARRFLDAEQRRPGDPK